MNDNFIIRIRLGMGKMLNGFRIAGGFLYSLTTGDTAVFWKG